MRLLRVLRQRARSFFRSAKIDAELENELAFHLEQLTRENREAGMDARAARQAALRAIGGMAQIEEECRDQRRIGWFTDLRQDVSYAWRMLRKSPGFTSLAVLTLGLGMGASVAVYALAEGLFLRSLPYPAPERLVSLYSVHALRSSSESVGQEDFREWQAASTAFERMAFSEFSQVTLTGFGEPDRVTGTAVSAGFFELLGVQPMLGRWFTPEEQIPGGERVVMLSQGLWARRFGSRPEVVGTSVTVNDRSYRVTGVMPAGFRYYGGGIGEYWTPIAYRSSGHRQHQYAAIARLKPGLTVAAAQAQMTEITRRMEAAYSDCKGWTVRVASMRKELLSEFGTELKIFAVAALIVLLVACGNIAALLLARGIGRSKEIAVRMAMGAGRRRLMRLLLTESVLLSCLGTVAGLVLAWWLLRLAVLAAPPWLRLEAMISVSPLLVAFAMGLTLATGILTGLWPAVRGSRAELQNDLKESGSALTAGRRQTRSLNGLVLMEIALAVVLLTFAGLLAKSFHNLLHIDLGYRTDGVLTFRMPLPSSRYRTDQARLQFWDRLLPQISALPGVVSAAASDSVPMGGTYSGTSVDIEGDTGRHNWAEVTSRGASVTPDYFRTLGIKIIAGRAFSGSDTPGSEPVAIVNEAFVRKLMPDRSALGTRMRLGGGNWMRIVGIIGDERYHGPADTAEAETYLPYTQDPQLQFVAIRTATREEGVFGGVRAVIRKIDPQLAFTQVRTMQKSVELATTLSREMMTLVTGFALVTLGMATLGLAGVMAYTVSRRKRELGLRMALGARRTDISLSVIRGAGALIMAGCTIGVACALVSARVLESLLYGVRPQDPLVTVAAPLVLGGIALAACMAPARRAASIEPMAALRQE